MTAGDALRAGGVVFAAAVLQAVLFSTLLVGGGAPNLLLVVIVCLGLLRPGRRRLCPRGTAEVQPRCAAAPLSGATRVSTLRAASTQV